MKSKLLIVLALSTMAVVANAQTTEMFPYESMNVKITSSQGSIYYTAAHQLSPADSRKYITEVVQASRVQPVYADLSHLAPSVKNSLFVESLFNAGDINTISQKPGVVFTAVKMYS